MSIEPSPKYAENLRRSMISKTGAVTDDRRRLAVLARNTGLVRHFEKSVECAFEFLALMRQFT